MFVATPTGLAEDADCMGVVDHQQAPDVVFDLDQLGQRANVAVHGEHAVGHYQRAVARPGLEFGAQANILVTFGTVRAAWRCLCGTSSRTRRRRLWKEIRSTLTRPQPCILRSQISQAQLQKQVPLSCSKSTHVQSTDDGELALYGMADAFRAHL